MRTPLLGLLALFLAPGCADAPKDKKETGGVSGSCTDDPAACDEDGDGFRPSDGDCDDSDADVNPSTPELCNGLDEDCDGQIDEDVQASWYQDFDSDGFGNPQEAVVACEAPNGYIANGTDCDDGESSAYPGATEVCDNIDNDCDGEIDNGVKGTYYADADGDTYGDPEAILEACEQPTGYVENGEDCDDSTLKSFPGNPEICDELDNNCDGTVDEGVTTTYYADYDSDSYGNASLTQEACSVPSGYTSNPDDCDDSQTAVNPAAIEVCNGIDDNCDGTIDEDTSSDASTWYADTDSDGYGDASASINSCSAPAGYVADSSDCDDARFETNPGVLEYCNGVDDDCDGSTDEDSAADATTWYLDADSDSYGDVTTSDVACTQPARYVADSTDCDDLDAQTYPGAVEYCDGEDDNCDGEIDEDTAADVTTWYRDADSDTYGNVSVSDIDCDQPAGYVADSTDCDDATATDFPGATEYCDGRDNNCDGTVDEDTAVDAATWYADTDGDAYGDAASPDLACTQPSGYVADATDCDDTRNTDYPGATEYCDGRDNNCDGTIDEDTAVDASTWYADADADTYGNPSVSDVACTQPSGYVLDSSDCNDTSDQAFPGGTEICDGLDNDCNGVVDDDGVVGDGTVYYEDTDSDGFGDPASTLVACSTPSGYADNAYDCNDTDSGEPMVADVVSGSTSGNGSLSLPYDLIQDAVNAAFECVLVYPGTYNEEIDLLGRDIDLWGIEGPDTTIIDANLVTCDTTNPTACNAAITIDSDSGAQPIVHGFSVTGGTGSMTSSSSATTCADSSASHTGRTSCTVTVYEYCGGGVFVDGDDPYLYDLIIRDNILPDFEQTSVGSFTQYWMYSYGGGVCLRNSNASIETTMIEGNFADQGGGIYAESGSSFTFDQGDVAENDASDGAGVNLSGASGAFTNAIVACNTATTDGGGLYTETSGTATFTNTVLYGNQSSTSGSTRGTEAYVGTSTTFNLYNSIAQAASSEYAIYGAGGTGTQTYNNVYNSSGSTYGGTLVAGLGGISSGSNFTSVSCDSNAYNDVYTLRTSSSSINAGDPDVAYNDTDVTRNDQGAYGGSGGSWTLP